MSQAFLDACDEPKNEAALGRLYEEVRGLIEEAASGERVVLHRIDASGPPAETAAALVALVRRLAKGRPVTVFLRDK